MTASKSRTLVREIGQPTFSSMLAFVDFCSVANPDCTRPASREGDRRFTGTRDFDSALKIAHDWKDGAAKVERARVSLKVQGRGVRRETLMRENGPGAFHMGAIAAELPRPYMVTRPTNRPKHAAGKIIRLHVNVCASAMVGTDVIERRGAAVLALVQALESSGRRVEIIVGAAVSSYGDSQEALVTRVAVKRPENKLNLQSVAFALSHPSMLRRLMFAAWEREDEGIRAKYGVGGFGSYGVPCDFRAPDGAIYLGRMYGTEPEWSSPESAAAWVRDAAAAQGITLH